jgi:hypothetical protein
MTHSEFIYPESVVDALGTGTPTFVGSGVWGDATDDSTMVVLQTDWTGDDFTSTIARVSGDLTGYEGTPTSGTTVLVHLRCYCQVLTGGSSPPPDATLQVDIYNATTFSPFVNVGDLAAPGGTPDGFAWAIPASTSGIPFVDYTIDLSETLGGGGDHFTEYGTTKDDMLAFLAGPMAISADIDYYNTAPVTKWEVGIAALYLEITELEDVVVPGQASAPPARAPLRQFPRDDGQLTATAGRAFPPSRSSTSSPRIGGAYI